MNAQRRWGPMSTLNGLGGAGSLTAVSVVALTLATSRARCAIARPGSAQQRADAADHLLRHRGALEQRLAEQLRAPGERPGRPRGRRLGRIQCVGRRVEQHGRDVDARDAVDERVVGLRDQREALAGQALDEPDLPQRLGAIQALGEQTPGQLGQRRLVGRSRERGVADVVARVEVGIVGPHRTALAVGHVREALAIARHEVQAAEHVIDQLLQARRLALEDHHRGHMHVRGRAFLELQEGRVQRGQPVGICHQLDCRC